MIIVKLWGGMCNQMFQYAFGYALAKKHNDKLVFDVDFYANQPGHVGKRGVMGKEQFPNISHLEFISRPAFAKPFENKYLSHLIRYNTGIDISLFGNHFKMEKLHRYENNVKYNSGDINYYDGYWQTERYFLEYAEDIRKEFLPTPEVRNTVMAWRNNISASNCIAVHIRRGDYLNKINQSSLKQGNVIGDIDYYMRAIAYMQERIINPVFCFFSDDIPWCKEMFAEKLPKSIFVENNGKNAALLDLFSIAQCEHGIMSPSTFSWWCNWLRNPQKRGFVIYPAGNYYDDFISNKEWIEIIN